MRFAYIERQVNYDPAKGRHVTAGAEWIGPPDGVARVPHTVFAQLDIVPRPSLVVDLWGIQARIIRRADVYYGWDEWEVMRESPRAWWAAKTRHIARLWRAAEMRIIYTLAAWGLADWHESQIVGWRFVWERWERLWIRYRWWRLRRRIRRHLGVFHKRCEHVEPEERPYDDYDY